VARLPELPARRVLTVLFRAGFAEARRSGSHRFLAHPDGRTAARALHRTPRRLAGKHPKESDKDR